MAPLAEMQTETQHYRPMRSGRAPALSCIRDPWSGNRQPPCARSQEFATATERHPIHEPRGRAAIRVLPEDVGPGVAIEFPDPIGTPASGGAEKSATTAQGEPIHYPHGHTAVAMPPEDVGYRIAVDISE